MNNHLNLLNPVKINQWQLRNRIVMAPLTRGFANDADGTVTEEMVAYYEQRARDGAGLIITEGINPSLAGKGTYGIPGLYTEEQAISWQKVTEAVHRQDGTIIAQLWHVGRLSHSDLIGRTPQAPSSIQAEGRCISCTSHIRFPKRCADRIFRVQFIIFRSLPVMPCWPDLMELSCMQLMDI